MNTKVLLSSTQLFHDRTVGRSMAAYHFRKIPFRAVVRPEMICVIPSGADLIMTKYGNLGLCNDRKELLDGRFFESTFISSTYRVGLTSNPERQYFRHIDLSLLWLGKADLEQYRSVSSCPEGKCRLLSTDRGWSYRDVPRYETATPSHWSNRLFQRRTF